MALTIYPNEGYDSFVTLTDATAYIDSYSIHSTMWSDLTDAQKEVYLRIATDRILNVVSTDSDDELYLDSETYVGALSCLPKACSMMAIHDIAYEISSSINPNQGLISKEKVGDLEVSYFHGNGKYPKGAKKINPFPQEVISCLTDYGAEFNVFGLLKAKVENS